MSVATLVPTTAATAAPAPSDRAPAAGIGIHSATGALPRIPGGDEAVTGTGDTDGYHLYAASSAGGWVWRPLATLQPGNYSDEAWTGHQCLTGDGRYVVAVVAPWHAVNGEVGTDRGGFAYRVDAHTGAVTPLAAGVSLAYFDPGCGTGAAVTLTSYAGAGQSRTRVSVVDSGTGKVTASVVVAAEVTSPVLASGRIVAAVGSGLVDVTSGRPVTLARLPGVAYQLRAAADGGVDLLSTDGGSARLWHWRAGRLSEVGAGQRTAVRLFGGRAGHNLAVGVVTRAAGTPVRAVAASGPVDAVSLDGGLAVGPIRVVSGHPHAMTTVAGRGNVDQALPAPVAARTSGVPETVLSAAGAGTRPATTTTVATGTSTTTTITTTALTTTTATDTTTTTSTTDLPKCSVPRNDLFKQVPQPNSAQVQWAVNQSVNNWFSPLVSGAAARPVDTSSYENVDTSNPFVPLAKGYPNADFDDSVPGVPGGRVPVLVMYGVLAQESNWSQASWHAAIGRTGNPLIANYYGTDANADSIDYSKADCGYGIGQVTDGMDGSPATDVQVRVAVDYATNIAAAVRILASKWYQLHADLNQPVSLNNDDASIVENWYAAIWAYNTGVHTVPDNGYTGLGWYNNPINPVWYPGRNTFLHVGQTENYGDASHPGDWPYQERVFGWMEVPLLDPAGNPRYTATYDWSAGTGRFLSHPPFTAFCDASNNCDPSLSSPCPANNSSCWFDEPVTWTDCSNCVAATTTGSPGDPEPAGTYRPVPCSFDSPGDGALIIDDAMIGEDNPTHRTPNGMGCDPADPGLVPPADSNGYSKGTFMVSDPTGTNGISAADLPTSVAAIDLHQIGAGIGGHAFFTHTRPASDATREVQAIWDARLLPGTAYEVKVYVPDLAAVGLAHYEIQAAAAGQPSEPFGYRRTINQNNYGNQWVSLGYYLSTKPPTGSGDIKVTLRTVTPDTDSSQGSDVAMDAVAFVPVPKGQYVAVGDSYSSGEGLQGGWDDGTDVTQNLPKIDSNDTSVLPITVADNGDLCHRAPQAFPRAYAAAVGIPVVHLACSGTNLWDLAGIEYWRDQLGDTIKDAGHLVPGPDSPPSGPDDHWVDSKTIPENAGSTYYLEQVLQTDLIQALAPSHVTLTIGGNDLGFAEIIDDCITRGTSLFSYSPCHNDYWNATGPDKLDVRISDLRKLVVTALGDVVAAVGGDPSKVTVVTYPAPIKYDAGESADQLDCTLMFNEDRQWLVPKLAEMDDMLLNAANDASATADPTGARRIQVIDERNAFAGHEACTTDSYITSPDLTDTNATMSKKDNYFHPNTEGYTRLTNDLLAALPNP